MKALTLLPILLLVAGCGGLSRNEAKDQLIGSGPFARTSITVFVTVGKSSDKVLSSCYTAPDIIQKWALKEGLIVQSRHGNDIQTSLSPAGNNLLTSEHKSLDPVYGEKLCDQSYVPIVIAEFSSLEVTGIIQQGTSASVDFAAAWKLTKAGNDLLGASGFWHSLSGEQLVDLDAQLKAVGGDDLLYTAGTTNGMVQSVGTATFLKYDDGWRLNKVT